MEIDKESKVDIFSWFLVDFLGIFWSMCSSCHESTIGNNPIHKKSKSYHKIERKQLEVPFLSKLEISSRTYIIFRTCMCNVKCININHSYLEQAHLTLCLFALENKNWNNDKRKSTRHPITSLCAKKSIFFFSVYLQHEDKSNNEFHHQLRKWRRWVINK